MILSVQMSAWIHGFPDTLGPRIKAWLKEAVSCFASRSVIKQGGFFNLDSILHSTRFLQAMEQFWTMSPLWSWEAEAPQNSVTLLRARPELKGMNAYFVHPSYCGFPRSLASSWPCLCWSFPDKQWKCCLLLWQQGSRSHSAVHRVTSTHADKALESVPCLCETKK